MVIPKTGLMWVLAGVFTVLLVTALVLPTEMKDTIRWDDVPGPVDSWTVEWNEIREVYECWIRLDDTGDLLTFELEIQQGMFPAFEPSDAPIIPDSWTELTNMEVLFYG